MQVSPLVYFSAKYPHVLAFRAALAAAGPHIPINR
jgi:hypothetical protein